MLVYGLRVKIIKFKMKSLKVSPKFRHLFSDKDGASSQVQMYYKYFVLSQVFPDLTCWGNMKFHLWYLSFSGSIYIKF